MRAFFDNADTIKYVAAFGFGTLIIFFFANRRIEQLVTFPPGEEFEVLRLLSTQAIGGRRAYRRAFIYYCVLLELIFVLLCILQPVANVMVGAPKDFKFDDVSWPFGAALVVVGLLPATPIFEQIELAFRKFAHRAAGIPEGFLASISFLGKSELKEKILSDKNRYSDEIERYHKVKNIVAGAGAPVNDAQYTAECDLLLGVFYGWTLSPQTSGIWSSAARAIFADIRNVTSTRVIRLRNDVEQLVRSSLDTAYLQQMRKELKADGLDIESDVDPKIIRATKAYDQDEKRRELFERWDAKIKEITLTAKQLIAMFVLLAANDDRPNSEDDPYLEEAIRLAWREQTKPLYNVGVIAVLGGFAATLVVCSSVSTSFEFIKRGALIAAIESGVYFGSLTSVNLAVQFGAALTVAMSIYYSRDLPARYGPDTPNSIIPISARVAVLGYSAITVVAISLIIYITYQLWTGKLTEADALSSKDLPKDLLFIIGWSLVPAVLALGCILLAHRVLRKKSTKIYSLGIVISVSITAFVILVLSRYEMSEAPFWTSIVSVVVFSGVTVALFRHHAERTMQAEVA